MPTIDCLTPIEHQLVSVEFDTLLNFLLSHRKVVEYYFDLTQGASAGMIPAQKECFGMGERLTHFFILIY